MQTLHAEEALFEDTIRIGIWNAERHTITSSLQEKKQIIKQILTDLAADILCINEGSVDLAPDNGYSIYSIPSLKYNHAEDERKVILWSKHPWREVDTIGAPSLPEGRFVYGKTTTAIGELAVIGVNIPWKFAHMSDGKGEKQVWEDHLVYLQGLRHIVVAHKNRGNLIVIGDYNQRIPRSRAPKHVYQALEDAFQGLQIATSGPVPGTFQYVMDHVAHTPELAGKTIGIMPNVSHNGTSIGNHRGVLVDMSRAEKMAEING